MKIIKPLKLSLLYKAYEEEKLPILTVSVISFFSFDPVGKLHSEVSLWQFVTEQLGQDGLLDLGMPKPRGEVLVTGSFYAPGGKPVKGGKVRLQLGSLNKQLHIFGDRQWQKQTDGGWTITDPQPIASLAISYSNAFGGPDYAKNPLGKGYIASLENADQSSYPLPNITDPKELLTSPTARIEPAGFGPYDLTWPQRFAKVGTYDQQWLKEVFPGFARDFDPTFFNTTPLNQQFNGYFNGNESFVCENMHPKQPVLASKLPGISPRCFINQSKAGAPVFQEVALQLDTVWLFPHAERGILIHRGRSRVADDQAGDVEHMLLAYERLGSPLRPVSHYEEALQRRLDPDKGYLYLLKESDLIPEGEISGFKEMIEEVSGAELGPLDKNLQNKKRQDAARAKEEFTALGLEAGDVFDKVLEEQVGTGIPDLDNLDVIVEETIRKVENTQKEAEQEFREMTESLGLNYDEMLEDAKSKAGGRMRFPADEICEQLRQFGSYSPEREEQLHRIEQEFDATYRKYGHHCPTATLPTQQQIESMQAFVLNRYDQGKSMTGLDLTGVDLSGLDLTGINLNDAFLEGANLSNANLRRANLNGCMLARADLSGAICDNAQMQGVNLGLANLSGTSFKNCTMDEAVLYRAIMKDACFHKASLRKADCMKCEGEYVDMQGADLSNTQFLESKLNSADFSNSTVCEALFLKAELHGVNFSGANLRSTIIVQSQGNGVTFAGADMTNLRAAMEISFRNADFSNSKLIDANLRGADLEGADFTQADLCMADLSEANLKNSRFYRATAKQAMFMKADLGEAFMVSINLFEGSLQGARLINTDLRGANLFAVDLLKADYSRANLDQANLGQTLLRA